MAQPFQLDPKLQPFATDRQWEILTAWVQHGSSRKAAEALGCNKSLLDTALKAVKKKAAQRGYAPDFEVGKPVAPGMVTRFVSTRYDVDGGVDAQWHSIKPEGMERVDTENPPDPRYIKRTAKLIDRDGKVIQHWITEEHDARRKDALWREFAEALSETIKPVAPTPISFKSTLRENILACYPIGDHHMGMLAWDKETGADYDIRIADKLLDDAVGYLVNAAPTAKTALLAVLGDFTHYDSFAAVTPTSRNLLDSDTRFPKMAKMALMALRRTVAQLLTKHEFVHIIIEIGNHDLATSIWLMLALEMFYENEPRVTVDISPKHFHYYRFGKVLIGTHHGHGAKMKDLPGIMAVDRKEDWGQTEKRYWWTGHIHHKEKDKDHLGCYVESFRVLATQDAWSINNGWRSWREMNMIVMHEDFGEVTRVTTTPDMFQ